MRPAESIPAILKELQQHRWTRLLLAVSGGVDSICLAHFFVQNKRKFALDWIGIAHIHHGLREGSADMDAELVQKFAEKNNVPFFRKDLDGKFLKASVGSLEENARTARYDALSEIAGENRANAIVTAHHAGDQAETVYLRMRRGVGLSGLRGIQPLRKLDEYSEIQLFRPFLSVTRIALEEYAHENHLEWREDESNDDTRFARNQIRHEALPHLEALNPGVSQQLCKIAALTSLAYPKILAQIEALFSPAVIPQEQWPFDFKYSRYDKVVALDLKSIDSIFSSTTAKTGAISELFRIWLTERGFRLPLKDRGTSIPHPFPQRFQCKSILMEKCRHILWFCHTSTKKEPKTGPNNLYFSADKFSDLVGQWRYRSKGDTLWPADEKIKARKLNQWLREQGIPQWMYESLPLFAQGSRILFVEGIRRTKKDDLKRKNDKG